MTPPGGREGTAEVLETVTRGPAWFDQPPGQSTFRSPEIGLERKKQLSQHGPFTVSHSLSTADTTTPQDPGRDQQLCRCFRVAVRMQLCNRGQSDRRTLHVLISPV